MWDGRLSHIKYFSCFVILTKEESHFHMFRFFNPLCYFQNDRALSLAPIDSNSLLFYLNRRNSFLVLQRHPFSFFFRKKGKDIAESRIKLLKKLISGKCWGWNNRKKKPEIWWLRVLIFHYTVVLRKNHTTKPHRQKWQSYCWKLSEFEHCFVVFLLVNDDFRLQI